MKTRNGFVSNSSSSSFVLIGTPVSFNELDLIEDPTKCIFIGCTIYGDGLDVFTLDKERLDWIKKHKYDIKKEVQIYKSKKYVIESEELPLEDIEIGPDDILITNSQAQGSGCYNEDDFIERYCTA